MPDTHAGFVHLRVHSAYSLSEGAIKIPKLEALCAKAHMPAVALPDTRNLFAALEFSVECAKVGVQPIIGCQLALRREESPTNFSGGHSNNQNQGRLPDPDALVL